MAGLGGFLGRLFGGKEPVEKETWIIFGLGNTGATYAHPRHNVGFDVTDRLARHYGVSLTRDRCKGLLAEVNAGDRRLVICQPQTLMNLSGDCVAPLMQWYKCPPERILVICDDIDLKPGALRLRAKGSAGTHNGLKSIVHYLPQGNFARLRVGVGAPPPEMDLVGWVLGTFTTPEEREAQAAALDRAAEAALDWFENGTDHAMTRFNGNAPRAEKREEKQGESNP